MTNFYTVDARTKSSWLLDGTTRLWGDALKEIVRLKRLLRPVCLEVHLYQEVGPRRVWVRGWKRGDRHSPWMPTTEEP